MEHIPYVTQASQKRDVRCTTRTAGFGCLFGLYKRQNSVGLIRNMVTVKIRNGATVTYFNLQSRYSPKNEENHMGVSVEICIKYFHQGSRAPRDLHEVITMLNKECQEGTGTVSSHPGERSASITQVAGKATGGLDALQKRPLAPSRIQRSSPTYIPA